MGQALYRKYRSKNLAEVVGQDHVTKTLESAIKSGRISHAYLLTGPRGVGKTSVARILAHEINGLPYDNDQAHLDIIEIDAASNRRIDEIRELRNKVHTAPASAKYKVYIIDEVHMLTKEAFNALLKTLEEPPQHVIFILATTEIHKLPETIISRTQRFAFKPVPMDQVAAHLKHIAKKEKLDITDDAVALIAQHGEGSFRDSISLLDQASGHQGIIDLDYVQSLLGIPPTSSMDALRDSLLNHDATATTKQITALEEQGFQPAQIAKQLGIAWRNHILENNHAQTDDFSLLQKLLDVPAAHNPERFLEIVLLEYALQPGTAPAPTAHLQQTAPAPEPKVTKPSNVKPTEQKSSAKAETTTSTITSTAVLDAATWPQVLAEIKKKYNTLYGVVRMAQPSFRPGVVELGFSFAFHRKRVSEAKNQQIISDTIKRITGQSVRITCVETSNEPEPMPEAIEVAEEAAATVASPEPAPIAVATAPNADISTISNIFGGGELLQS